MKRIFQVTTFLLSVATAFSSFGQTITTFAGNGTAGFSGDGAAATAAKINAPYAVTADPYGNVYFGDQGNYRLRKINSSGVISTFAGTGSNGYTGDGGQATAAQIGAIRGIAVDFSSNVYFTDDHCVVRKIDVSSGVISTVAGINLMASYSGDGGQATAAKLNYPRGIAFDYSGDLLIADEANNRIRKVTMSTGIISTIAGTGSSGLSGDGGPATAALLNVPTGVAVGITGIIYIADYGNNRVRRINTAGNIAAVTWAGSSAGYGYSGDGGPATAAHFYYPTGVATDSSGNVFISDQNNNVVRKVNSFGIVNTIAGSGYLAGTGTGAFGGDGGLATAASLNQPSTCYVTSALGKIYIADKDNNRIRVIGTLHKPFFTNGHSQSLTACQGVTSVRLDTLLAVDDIDLGQTEIWTLVSPAAHGALVVGYTMTSTGGTLIPTGLTYSPFGSYFGADSFSVRVFDGTGYDTTVIHVDILPTVPYSIIGPDSICPGDTATLTYIVPGGTWTSIHSAIAGITSTGFVTALTPGHDTITYSFTNACGTVTIAHPLTVGSYTICHTGVSAIGEVVKNEITAYPNPAYGSLTLNVTSAVQGDVSVVITNILGETVKEFTTAANKPIEMQQDYPAGVYFIAAYSTEGKFATKMIVKL